MMDDKGTVAQRNDACYALRGQRSAEVVSVLKRALGDKTVRVCAARDLREAGAVDALLEGLAGSDADTQMAAARELGELRDPRALEALGSVALSDNVLLASSAVSALGAYEGKAALPYLLRAAGQSGVSSVTALELAARSHDPAVLTLARARSGEGRHRSASRRSCHHRGSWRCRRSAQTPRVGRALRPCLLTRPRLRLHAAHRSRTRRADGDRQDHDEVARTDDRSVSSVGMGVPPAKLHEKPSAAMVGRTPWSAADAPVGLLRAETAAGCWFFDPVALGWRKATDDERRSSVPHSDVSADAIREGLRAT